MMSFEGINNNNKPSSKVLRPPGGGTSDIFGGDIPQTPRTLVKNHMQSNIFSTDKDHVKNSGDHPRRAQKNLDSYQRLFGEPERPMTPAKNHMRSNIPFGTSNETAAQTLITNGSNGHYNGKSGSVSSASSSVSSSTENLKINGHSKTDGNPVTGEGYKTAEFNNHTPSMNGANQIINKNRIPPGGYSSGLW